MFFFYFLFSDNAKLYMYIHEDKTKKNLISLCNSFFLNIYRLRNGDIYRTYSNGQFYVKKIIPYSFRCGSSDAFVCYLIGTCFHILSLFLSDHVPSFN